MRVLARKFLGVRTGVRVWCAIDVTFQGDGRHGDGRSLGELLFYIIIFGLACSQAEPPAVIVNHNAHMIRIVERRRCTLECRVIERPLGRSGLPDELVEVVPVLLVARSASLDG